MQLILTEHAYQQYRARVEDISKAELQVRIVEQYRHKEIDYNRRGYMRLSGVWWVYDKIGDTMVLITCYGRTTLNLPKALGWAARQNDKIDLNHLV